MASKKKFDQSKLGKPIEDFIALVPNEKVASELEDDFQSFMNKLGEYFPDNVSKTVKPNKRVCEYCKVENIKVPDMLTNEISQRLKEINYYRSNNRDTKELERKLRLIILGANYAAKDYKLRYENGVVFIDHMYTGYGCVFSTVWPRGDCHGL